MLVLPDLEHRLPRLGINVPWVQRPAALTVGCHAHRCVHPPGVDHADKAAGNLVVVPPLLPLLSMMYRRHNILDKGNDLPSLPLVEVVLDPLLDRVGLVDPPILSKDAGGVDQQRL